MKRIKTFKIFESESEFDLQDAINKITDKYSDMEVAQMLDEEITGGGWVDDDWEDEHESMYDAYMETGRGEAEDVVVSEIITWYESEHGKIENVDDKIELGSEIRDEFSLSSF